MVYNINNTIKIQGDEEMKISKIIYKILLVTLLIITVASSAYQVQATDETAGGSGSAGAGTGLPDLSIFRPTGGGSNQILSKIGGILSVLRLLGVVMTVVSIAIIGFGTILGSASEKADYQQKLTGVIFAGIFLIASTSIAKLIISVAVQF